ncbi:MAG: precorrin-6A/cobalt-precorrin-6A reductase, partial [Pseudomonadota bacterium]
LLVDATHPFAEQMTRHAWEATQETAVRHLHLRRPEWTPMPPEQWIQVPDLDAAAAVLPSGARAFAATGRGSLDAFSVREDVFVILRVFDPPSIPFQGNGTFEVARPPFAVSDEVDRLTRFRATHLVVKNAGGAPARTKLTAAAELGLPIVIVTRPRLPDGIEPIEAVPELLSRIDRPGRENDPG